MARKPRKTRPHEGRDGEIHTVMEVLAEAHPELADTLPKKFPNLVTKDSVEETLKALRKPVREDAPAYVSHEEAPPEHAEQAGGNGKPPGYWANKTRPFHSFKDTGIKVVQTEDRKAIGLQFSDDRKPDSHERQRMGKVGEDLQAIAENVDGRRQSRVGFFPKIGSSWLTQANEDSRPAMERLGEELHQRRLRMDAEKGREGGGRGA